MSDVIDELIKLMIVAFLRKFSPYFLTRIDIVSEGFSHEGSFRWKGTVGANFDCDSAVPEAEMFDDGMNHFDIMRFNFNSIW